MTTGGPQAEADPGELTGTFLPVLPAANTLIVSLRSCCFGTVKRLGAGVGLQALDLSSQAPQVTGRSPCGESQGR